MAEQSPAESELEAAIAENPEEVAAFVQRLDAVNELLDLLDLGESAMSDEMIRSLSDTGSTLAESADGLATEESVELADTIGANGTELQDALESLLELQESGALDDIMELAQVLSLVSSALDDEMVRSLAGTGSALGEVAQTATDDAVQDGLETVLTGVGTAEREAPSDVGTRGLVSKLRDGDTKRGLAYLLTLAEAIGQSRHEP